MTTGNGRTADYPVDAMFLERWSPRAFTGEAISQTELMTLLEAARWAPSSYNAQPWRFIYAHRDTPAWEALFSLLIPFNQMWVKDAAALIFIVSNSRMRMPGAEADTPSWTHSLDAGTASGFLALQAFKHGWVVHGMSGFDTARAPESLGVPDGWRVEAAYAIGRQGDKATLPAPLQAKEAPSSRLPLAELVYEGRWPR